MAFYRLAAKQGYAPAQYNLGIMYDKGEGVPQNYEEAMKWFHLAAKQGNPEAQKVLADPMYDFDAHRWMTECVKEWHPMYGLTKQQHFAWCKCKVKALFSVKTQLSQATKDELATYFDGAMKKVPSEVIDEAYKCYHK